MNKEKKIIYTLKINQLEDIPGDKNMDNLLFNLFTLRNSRGFSIKLEFANGMSDCAINETIEQYIARSLDPNDSTYGLICTKKADEFCSYTKIFIQNLLKYIFIDRQYSFKTSEDFDKYDYMDVFRRIENREYVFKVRLPIDLINDERKDKIMAMGPDYLSTVLNGADIFNYVIPQFFYFLCDIDAFDDPNINDLNRYMIGFD